MNFDNFFFDLPCTDFSVMHQLIGQGPPTEFLFVHAYNSLYIALFAFLVLPLLICQHSINVVGNICFTLGLYMLYLLLNTPYRLLA